MIYTYLKILIRSCFKNKTAFAVNIIGLTLGLACFMLIYLYVSYEYGYDKHIKDPDNSYRIIKKEIGQVYMGTDMFSVTQAPLVSLLKDEFPEVVCATHIDKQGGLVQSNQKSFMEQNMLFVDPDFLDIHSINLIAGDENEALKNPYSIMLTQSMAFKYFGNENPFGKTLKINETHLYTITGIIPDCTAQSHLKYDMLASFSTKFIIEAENCKWNSSNNQTYIILKKGTDIASFEKKITQRIIALDGEKNTQYFLQPITNVHLQGNCNFEIERNGDLQQVNTFLIIGFLILIIACFNYVNLSSAQKLGRIKEVGIAKAIGASGYHLFIQHLGESMLYFLFSTLLATVILYTSLPILNNFLNKQIPFDYVFRPEVIGVVITTIVIVCIISGLISAIGLNRFNPIHIIRGTIVQPGKNAINYRWILVMGQFVISIILIVCTLVATKQVIYLNNKDLGYSKQNIITTFIRDRNCRKQYQAIKAELMKNPNIVDVAVSQNLPNNITNNNYLTILIDKPEEEQGSIYFSRVAPNFLEFYGIQVKEGVSLIGCKDIVEPILLNSKAIRACNIKNPIGQLFKYSNSPNATQFRIVGIINDINFNSLSLDINPLMIRLIKDDEYSSYGSNLSIKINGQQSNETFAFIGKTLKTFSPTYPFELKYFDEQIAKTYESETRFQTLIQLFSLIAIFIACLGLLGLAHYNLARRVKEIGIRKINGAKISEILTMLNRDFVKWVAIAFIIATPIAYYAMNKWLESFAYKTELSWWIFALAGLLALGIALLTVSWQSWKAATRR